MVIMSRRQRAGGPSPSTHPKEAAGRVPQHHHVGWRESTEILLVAARGNKIVRDQDPRHLWHRVDAPIRENPGPMVPVSATLIFRGSVESFWVPFTADARSRRADRYHVASLAALGSTRSPLRRPIPQHRQTVLVSSDDTRIAPTGADTLPDALVMPARPLDEAVICCRNQSESVFVFRLLVSETNGHQNRREHSQFKLFAP